MKKSVDFLRDSSEFKRGGYYRKMGMLAKSQVIDENP